MKRKNSPSFGVSLIPIVALIVSLVVVIYINGADAVQSMSQVILLGNSLLAYLLTRITTRRDFRIVWVGLVKGSRQILPSIPILLLIATISATWMLSGVVPTLIYYGLEIISPRLFLLIACVVCAAISVLSGSSWTTIATIGVAFMGIGTVLGYNEAWIAGAVISGAYFGDKCSPLSDTTVLASSSCGVELFTHIKYLMITTIPALLVALIVYGVVGYVIPIEDVAYTDDMIIYLQDAFNISPWVLSIPIATVVLICCRVNTIVTLSISTLLGLLGLFVFQTQVVDMLSSGSGIIDYIMLCMKVLFVDTAVDTKHELLNSLVSTSGVQGMLPTVWLVLCAMVFGGVMLGTGMLGSISRAFTRRLVSARTTVGATVASGLFLNATTADQYLSIIIGGNLYKNIYKRNGLEARLLSRTLEDSISVTSVLIPWNSCGITQATVLGVATLTYLPYCIFNIVSPLMSLLVVSVGWRMRSLRG